MACHRWQLTAVRRSIHGLAEPSYHVRANTPLGRAVPLSFFAGTCQGLQGVGRGNKEDTVAKGENDVADLELAAQFLGVFRRTCSGNCPCGKAARGCVGECPTKARDELLYSLRPAHSLICGCLHERVLNRWRVLAKGECTTVDRNDRSLACAHSGSLCVCSVVSSVYFTGEFGNRSLGRDCSHQRVWCGGRVLTRARP